MTHLALVAVVVVLIAQALCLPMIWRTVLGKRSIEILRIKPGDVIVWQVDRKIPAEAAAHVRDMLEEKFPGHKALVISEGHLRVARREER